MLKVPGWLTWAPGSLRDAHMVERDPVIELGNASLRATWTMDLLAFVCVGWTQIVNNREVREYATRKICFGLSNCAMLLSYAVCCWSMVVFRKSARRINIKHYYYRCKKIFSDILIMGKANFVGRKFGHTNEETGCWLEGAMTANIWLLQICESLDMRSIKYRWLISIARLAVPFSIPFGMSPDNSLLINFLWLHFYNRVSLYQSSAGTQTTQIT